MQRGRWNLAALSCHTKSLVWKNSTAAAARPQTNCITYTHSRKRIQKPSTLLHCTSQHTKKAENPQKKKQNPIKIHKQNPHRILKNKTPKTNQPAVCSAVDFDLVWRHVLLPASLLFPPASDADATATALQKSWGQSNITNLRLWFACEQHSFKLLRNWNPSTTTSSHIQEAFLSLAAVAAPLDRELSSTKVVWVVEAGAAATFDCKLKAQSHFITSSTRSTPSQSTDRRSVPLIKHAQRERER